MYVGLRCGFMDISSRLRIIVNFTGQPVTKLALSVVDQTTQALSIIPFFLWGGKLEIMLGKMVHYVLPDLGLAGEERAALVIGQQDEQVTLLVYLLPSDVQGGKSKLRYVEGAEQSQEVHRNGTWHFIRES